MYSILPYQTQLHPILFKLVPANCLSNDINCLVYIFLRDHFDKSILHIDSKEVMSDISMLSSLVLNRILGHIDCTCVITNKGTLYERIQKSFNYCLI